MTLVVLLASLVFVLARLRWHARGYDAAMQTQRLSVPRTARYHVAGELSGAAREVWFALHGYGQLAAELVHALEPSLPPGTLLIAPEALSRFYLRSGTGRVGASWMTSEARADEIADQIGYLDRLWCAVVAEHGAQDAALNVLGFSQGAAAAARWAVLGDVRARRLVLWAGGFPPDLERARVRAALAGVRVELVVGDSDPVLGAERVLEEETRLSDLGVEPLLSRFAGGHELEPAALARILGAQRASDDPRGP